MRRLDGEGIAFYIKSVDSYGPCYEAAEIARASGIQHTVNFRMSSSSTYNFDVPNYGLNADDAAYIHWQATIANLPPEYRYDDFHKDFVWLEVVNEVDKNQADWIGWFSLRIAILAIEQGYRVALPSWSPGEPELSDWQTNGMRAFLEYAAEHSDRIAVSVHEYSLEEHSLANGYNHLIGRIEALFSACNDMGIARPTVLITEFGWTYNYVPDPDEAMPQIDYAGNYYYQYPNVLGAAIWYLGPGFGGIADKAQRLIAPVGNYAVAFDYTTVPDPDPDPDPINPCDFNDGLTKYHILRPRSLSPSQWEFVREMMDDGIPKSTLGLPGLDRVIVGYEGWSHVDAIMAIKRAVEAGYTNSRLIVLDGDQIGTGLDDAWMRANCSLVAPYTVYFWSETTPDPDPPAGEPALIGLHASADPALAAGEIAMMQAARIEVVKMLSSIDKNDVNRINAAFPNIPVIIRAFLSWGGRNVTPQQFVDWTLPDVRECVSRVGLNRPIYVELHNEPNLFAEGLGHSWANGVQFNDWLLSALRLYQQGLGGVGFLYPGLSPGPSVQGVRMDSTIFLEQSLGAANACDGVAIHNYWSDIWPMQLALSQIAGYISVLGSKMMWVTEASNNRSTTSPTEKGSQYVRYAQELARWPNIQGVTYFIASASNSAWQWPSGSGEVWLGTDIPSVVGSR